MNAFKKLALAAAVASVPMVGVAMEPLNDEGLSNVTGQDGITINVDLNQLKLNMYIEDTDGLTGVDSDSRTGAGMIAITGLELNTNDGINIDIDAGSNTGAGASSGVLRLGIKIPHLSINPDVVDNTDPANPENIPNPFSIGVAGVTNAAVTGSAQRSATDGWDRIVGDGVTGGANEWGAIGQNGANITEVISLGNITLENLDLAIELGPEASNFLAISTDSAIDITLNNFELNDASTSGGGSLFTDEISITNIELDGTTASITASGLELTMGGSTGSGMNVALMGLGFGDSTPGTGSAALGNVYIDGLDLGGTKVTVSGH